MREQLEQTLMIRQTNSLMDYPAVEARCMTCRADEGWRHAVWGLGANSLEFLSSWVCGTDLVTIELTWRAVTALNMKLRASTCLLQWQAGLLGNTSGFFPQLAKFDSKTVCAPRSGGCCLLNVTGDCTAQFCSWQQQQNSGANMFQQTRNI